MKTIHIAGRSFFSGTEIADAVMRYGLELARVELLDDVEILFVDSDGMTSRALIRIGWRIDMILTFRHGDVDSDELVGVETIFALLEKTQQLHALRTDND